MRRYKGAQKQNHLSFKPTLLPEKIRLNRLIAQCSELSRRAADAAISAGQVSVNGEKVTSLGMTVNPYESDVRVDGKKLELPKSHLYLAFNKPRSALVTKSDPLERRTIWSYLGELGAKLNSAGRLDYDTEGLIILSSDGNFLQKLTHPRYEIWKTYQVQVKGVPSDVSLETLRKGVHLDDGVTRPARVKLNRSGETSTWIEISIHEGKNHQVKRMCEAIGHPVVKLRRIAIGPLELKSLKPGKYRPLKPQEIQAFEKIFVSSGKALPMPRHVS
ncbi:MAG: rRNA pseudouridine synthase [Deltaproteobacteria bacterium]|nr:rRNA pseudouridine synthase [Deltaproteobacteria bacterium]